MRYTDHLEYLVAGINYLSRSGPWARTLSYLATELGLDAQRLQLVFEGFPGLFRKSLKTAKHTDNSEHYFSLQARYAQRPDYGKTDEVTLIDPLSPQEIEMTLDFVLQAVQREQQTGSAKITNWIAVSAAVASAATAIIVALISQSGN
jgi:hypothetical protein